MSCNIKKGVKEVTIMNLSDIKNKDSDKGELKELKMKRKYGKFTRPVIKVNLDKETPKQEHEINFYIPKGVSKEDKNRIRKLNNNNN